MTYPVSLRCIKTWSGLRGCRSRTNGPQDRRALNRPSRRLWFWPFTLAPDIGWRPRSLTRNSSSRASRDNSFTSLHHATKFSKNFGRAGVIRTLISSGNSGVSCQVRRPHVASKIERAPGFYPGGSTVFAMQKNPVTPATYGYHPDALVAHWSGWRIAL